jgi:hypothetical protein
MKPVSSTFVSFIASSQQMPFCELYTFEFSDGTFAYYTDLDKTIFYSGHTFLGSSLRIEGLRYKLTNTFEVDEQEVRISAFPDETLGSAAFFTAVGGGLLDNAKLTRQRAFWDPSSDQRPFIVFQNAPLEVVTLFTGFVSTITKLGQTHVEFKVKSPLRLFDMDMPRNSFSPGCLWTLFDAGCTLSKASFTTSFVVGSANPLTVIPTTSFTQTGADGIPNYYQGRLHFLSGVNAGLQVVIANNDATQFNLQYPLYAIPNPGDTFEASVGCSKLDSTCSAKFANLANFRGFPRVPPVVVSI